MKNKLAHKWISYNSHVQTLTMPLPSWRRPGEAAITRSTVRPGAAETQNDFFHIPLLFISLNEGEIYE